MYDLNGKVALVTGAGGEYGIGRAIALRFAKEGANVVVNDLKENPKNSKSWSGLPDVVKEMEVLGQKALGITGDISDVRQVNSMFQRTIQAFGKLDILVNNAGSPVGPDRVPVVELEEEVWDLVQRVNVKGAFLCSKAAAQILMDQDHGGKIINMSSIAGRFGIANYGAYCTSKFAVRGLTQVLAKELGPHGIQVNAICPGMIVTERTYDIAKALAPKAVSADELLQERKNLHTSETPLGRVGTPHDIAKMTAFLASSESDFLTGLSFTVDGGRLMD